MRLLVLLLALPLAGCETALLAIQTGATVVQAVAAVKSIPKPKPKPSASPAAAVKP
jgi:hypothetical protein